MKTEDTIPRPPKLPENFCCDCNACYSKEELEERSDMEEVIYEGEFPACLIVTNGTDYINGGTKRFYNIKSCKDRRSINGSMQPSCFMFIHKKK
jgi:hypothetical protein